MPAAVQVRGIREVRSAFRKVDKDLPSEFRKEFLGIAQKVQGGIQQKVPWQTGAAARSVRARASQSGAGIAFGGNAAPYFPWLDFGGSTGKGHRPGVARSGSVKRDWMGRPVGEGRYVYPTIEEMRPEIEDATEDVPINVARRAGFEVR